MRLEVLPSGIWQLSAVLLESGGACLVVDPGYFPREVEELARRAAAHGRVEAVAFTHGHWDHVVGWSAFAGAEVWASPVLCEAVAGGGELARKSLDEARDFDGRWYVERPLAWPMAMRALGDGERVRLGELEIEALLLPGHSPDGLALRIESAGLLLAGDHLSPCEIPFVQDLAAYRATLDRLAAAVPSLVVPGHGPILTRAKALAILDGDRRYLEALDGAAQRGDVAGARAIPLPRAAAVPGIAEHHLENCRAAGLAV